MRAKPDFKLGLKVPTNFEVLRKIEIAFTKNDQDGNGIDDTYGIMLSGGIQYDYVFNADYDSLNGKEGVVLKL